MRLLRSDEKFLYNIILRTVVKQNKIDWNQKPPKDFEVIRKK